MNIMMNLILANLIRLFHFILILFIIIVPFTDKSGLLVLHVFGSLSLLLHWALNSDVCSLSMMESHLRGNNYTETFTHKFIAPVYNISESNWSRTCKIIVVLLMFKSISALLMNSSFKRFIENPTLQNSIMLLRV